MMALTTLLGVFVWLLGLSIGSFLNVVIYRLPLGLSLSSPRWSFCPNCKTTIAWYDNIPVLSWLLLRGRCRRCAAPISVQYPLVEATTGLAFALVFGLLVLGDARVGLLGFNWLVDWPLLLGWLILTAALVACAGMDFVAYMIDVRVTNFALIAGLVLMAFWNRPEFMLPTAQSPLAGGLIAAFVIGLIRMAVGAGRAAQTEPGDDDQTADADEKDQITAAPPSGAGRVGPLGFACVVLLSLGLALVLAGNLTDRPWMVLQYLVPAAFAVLMAILCLAGGEPRAADEELHDALESEAPRARVVVLHELAWLLPPILGGTIVTLLLLFSPSASEIWSRIGTAICSTGIGGGDSGGLKIGVAGVAFAIHGAMAGIVLGWLVRILFTLVFGREAFGVGDIYILAAAGAATGWDIVLLAFPLAVGVAILTFIVSLLRKRTAMLAFGPPLALGFLLALWVNRPATVLALQRIREIEFVWSTRRDVAMLGIGLMLVGAAIAVILARVVRRLIER